MLVCDSSFYLSPAMKQTRAPPPPKQRVPPPFFALPRPAARYNIFDEAIAEVLDVMEMNFKADFERTTSFRDLNRAVQREARELQVLRQVRWGAARKA